jgi:mRNA-degrading endonuclease RelE of RelBE toxin-antitoxin system
LAGFWVIIVGRIAGDHRGRFAESGTGDIKALQGGVEEMRLRVGDYRLFFVATGDDVIEVRRVRHRREAYR